MKQKEIKHGGVRLGSGRPCKWARSGKTKSVRIPAAYVDKILQVVSYMDGNDGQLPLGISFFTEENFSMPGYDASGELPYPRRYSRRGFVE